MKYLVSYWPSSPLRSKPFLECYRKPCRAMSFLYQLITQKHYLAQYILLKLSPIFRFLFWAISLPPWYTSWEITYTMFSNISIILKLQFSAKYRKMLQHFWKIQSVGMKFSWYFRMQYWQNFRCRNTTYSHRWHMTDHQ